MKKLLLLLLPLLLSGCTYPPSSDASFPSDAPVQEAMAPAVLPQDSRDAAVSPPPQEDVAAPREERAAQLLSAMTTEEKVGQLFFARCPASEGAELAAQYHLGGYLLFGRDFKDKSAQEVRSAISSCQQSAAIPMLIGVDEEGGSVVRVSGNPALRAEKFSSPQALYAQGGLAAITADAQEKDALLRSLGINVNFAPVADVSVNSADFIYPRTLGLGAEETAQYTAAVVAQMEADGMGSVLKHFPGYGSNLDTHTGSARDTRSLEEFQSADFLPFRAGIDAACQGTAAVLVSHNVMEAADPDRPASLSPAVHSLLREELGFEGTVLTDDLDMEAAAQFAGEYPTAVLAILAGNDMLVTGDFQTQIPQVLAALEDGTISLEQLDQAVIRVLTWKDSLGLLNDTAEEHTP